jgi:exodeoxyribonuclease VII large subunit
VLQLNTQVLQLQNQLERGLNQYLAQKQLQLQSLALQLQALSPLSTLGRGYAIVRNSEQVLVKSTQQVSKGDVVNIQLQDGSIHCEVLGKSS